MMEEKDYIEEKSGKSKKNPPILIILLFFVLIGIIVVVINKMNVIQNFFGQKKYEDIAESVKSTTVAPTVVIESETEEDTESLYVSPINFEELWARNPDVIGWVTIPNTQVDYPILWSGDNDFYLHHDIDNQQSVYGAIYLDGEDKPDFTSLHNITYGHHMKNGSMYENIVNFKDEEFFKNNRDVYIYTPDKEYHLRTMACLYTEPVAERRKVLFADKTEFDTYVDTMTEKCSFRELPLDGVNRLWSFVTCSYEFNDARTILYCYEVDDEGNKIEPNEELYTNQYFPTVKPSEKLSSESETSELETTENQQ